MRTLIFMFFASFTAHIWGQLDQGLYMFCAKDRISTLKIDTNKQQFTWVLEMVNHHYKSKGPYIIKGDTLILNPQLDVKTTLDTLISTPTKTTGKIHVALMVDGKAQKNNYAYKILYPGSNNPVYMSGSSFILPDTVSQVRLYREGLIMVDFELNAAHDYQAFISIEDEKTSLIRSVHFQILNERTVKTIKINPMKLLESNTLEYFFLDDKKEIDLCEYYKNLEILGLRP